MKLSPLVSVATVLALVGCSAHREPAGGPPAPSNALHALVTRGSRPTDGPATTYVFTEGELDCVRAQDQRGLARYVVSIGGMEPEPGQSISSGARTRRRARARRATRPIVVTRSTAWT